MLQYLVEVNVIFMWEVMFSVEKVDEFAARALYVDVLGYELADKVLPGTS